MDGYSEVLHIKLEYLKGMQLADCKVLCLRKFGAIDHFLELIIVNCFQSTLVHIAKIEFKGHERTDIVVL